MHLRTDCSDITLFLKTNWSGKQLHMIYAVFKICTADKS